MSDDYLPPFQRHSETSRQGALDFAPRAASARMKVYAYIRECGPVTDHQVQQALGMAGSTQRPRRIELERRGHVTLVGREGRRGLYSATEKPIPDDPPRGYWTAGVGGEDL